MRLGLPVFWVSELGKSPNGLDGAGERLVPAVGAGGALGGWGLGGTGRAGGADGRDAGCGGAWRWGCGGAWRAGGLDEVELDWVGFGRF